MLHHEQLLVQDFSTAQTDIAAELDYPGERPASSFVTNGTVIRALPDTYAEFVSSTDALLTDYGLPTIAARYPVLAYGANASPYRLAKKINEVADKSRLGDAKRRELHMTPFIQSDIPNALAVWHGRPGQKGATFAEIYTGEHARNTSLKAHVSFLTVEQLGIIHASEGETYGVAEISATLGSGPEAPVITYGALRSQIAVDERGLPILVSPLAHRGAEHLHQMTARQMVAYMLDRAGVELSVEEHIERALPLKLAEKKVLQKEVGDKLDDAGASQSYAFDAPRDAFVGRADFVSLPGNHDRHVYHIPEMILAGIRPSRETIADKVESLKNKEGETAAERYARAVRLIDPARKLSQRAHGELAIAIEQGER